MAEKVKVLVPEEDVAKRIKELGEQISKRLCRKAGTSDLCIEGWRILHVRTGEENHRSGINGLYECQQLR